MNFYKRIIAVLFSGFLFMGLSACEKSAEDVGEAIDDAASDVADEAEGAADSAKEELGQ
jgi:hypothetical protein